MYNILIMKLEEKFNQTFDKMFVKSGLQERLRLGMQLISSYIPLHFTADQTHKMKMWVESLSKHPEKTLPKAVQRVDANKELEGPDLTCLKDTLGVDDDFLSAVFQLGMEQIKQEHFKEAAALFTVMIVFDSFSAESYLCLGMAEAALGHKEQAESNIGISLALAPEDPTILQYIGHYYQSQNEEKVAKEFYQLAKKWTA